MRFIVACVFLVCALLALLLAVSKAPADLHIVSVNETHTYTVREESVFAFEFLANRDDTHHFLKEAIHGAGVVGSCNEKRYPLSLLSIEKNMRPFGEELYHHYRLAFAPKIAGGIEKLAFSNASLQLVYGRFPNLTLPIGEFNVTYEENLGDALTLQAVRSVPGDEGFGLSAFGVFLTLENTASRDVVVTEISLNAQKVVPDLASSLFKEDPGHPDDFDALFSEYERFNRPSDGEAIFPASSTKTLFVPFSYLETTLLHRYPLVIDYRLDNQKGRLMLNDFLFINTNRFASENEEAFVHVRPD